MNVDHLSIVLRFVSYTLEFIIMHMLLLDTPSKYKYTEILKLFTSIWFKILLSFVVKSQYLKMTPPLVQLIPWVPNGKCSSLISYIASLTILWAIALSLPVLIFVTSFNLCSSSIQKVLQFLLAIRGGSKFKPYI
jgi:hypothetical protein